MSVEVKGLSELKKFLDEFPAKLQNNVMRGAMSAAAKVTAKEAKLLCPVGVPSSKNAKIYGGYEGALRDSIRVSPGRIDSAGGKVVAKVVVGGVNKKGADVWYAHMVEFTGAVAHPIMAKKGSALTVGGRLVADIPEHPGFHAKAFMRPALDNTMGAAVVAAGEYVKKKLATKQGIDTADIVVEEV